MDYNPIKPSYLGVIPYRMDLPEPIEPRLSFRSLVLESLLPVIGAPLSVKSMIELLEQSAKFPKDYSTGRDLLFPQ